VYGTSVPAVSNLIKNDKINHNFFQKVIPMFLRALCAHLYSVTITWAASLCPLQKKFVVAHQATVAQKVLTSTSALNLFRYKSTLSGPNR